MASSWPHSPQAYREDQYDEDLTETEESPTQLDPGLNSGQLRALDHIEQAAQDLLQDDEETEDQETLLEEYPASTVDTAKAEAREGLLTQCAPDQCEEDEESTTEPASKQKACASKAPDEHHPELPTNNEKEESSMLIEEDDSSSCGSVDNGFGFSMGLCTQQAPNDDDSDSDDDFNSSIESNPDDHSEANGDDFSNGVRVNEKVALFDAQQNIEFEKEAYGSDEEPTHKEELSPPKSVVLDAPCTQQQSQKEEQLVAMVSGNKNEAGNVNCCNQSTATEPHYSLQESKKDTSPPKCRTEFEFETAVEQESSIIPDTLQNPRSTTETCNIADEGSSPLPESTSQNEQTANNKDEPNDEDKDETATGTSSIWCVPTHEDGMHGLTEDTEVETVIVEPTAEPKFSSQTTALMSPTSPFKRSHTRGAAALDESYTGSTDNYLEKEDPHLNDTGVKESQLISASKSKSIWNDHGNFQIEEEEMSEKMTLSIFSGDTEPLPQPPSSLQNHSVSQGLSNQYYSGETETFVVPPSTERQEEKEDRKDVNPNSLRNTNTEPFPRTKLLLDTPSDRYTHPDVKMDNLQKKETTDINEANTEVETSAVDPQTNGHQTEEDCNKHIPNSIETVSSDTSLKYLESPLDRPSLKRTTSSVNKESAHEEGSVMSESQPETATVLYDASADAVGNVNCANVSAAPLKSILHHTPSSGSQSLLSYPREQLQQHEENSLTCGDERMHSLDGERSLKLAASVSSAPHQSSVINNKSIELLQEKTTGMEVGCVKKAELPENLPNSKEDTEDLNRTKTFRNEPTLTVSDEPTCVEMDHVDKLEKGATLHMSASENCLKASYVVTGLSRPSAEADTNLNPKVKIGEVSIGGIARPDSNVDLSVIKRQENQADPLNGTSTEIKHDSDLLGRKDIPEEMSDPSSLIGNAKQAETGKHALVPIVNGEDDDIEDSDDEQINGQKLESHPVRTKSPEQIKASSEAPWIRTNGGDKKAKSGNVGAMAKEQSVTFDHEHSPRLRLPLPSVCSTKEAVYESDSSQEILSSPIIKRATFREEENKYYELTNTQDDELKPKSKEKRNLSFSRLVKGLPARDETEPKRAPRHIRRKNLSLRSSEPRPPDQVNGAKKGIEEDDVSDQGSCESSYVEASQTDNCINNASQDTVAHAKLILKKHKAKDSPVLGEGVQVLLTRIELTEKENIKLKSKLQILQGAFDKLKSECKERGRICNELSTELERYSETEDRIQKECDRVSTPQPVSVHRPSTRSPNTAKVVGDVQQRSGKKRKQNEADDDGTVLAKLDTVSRSLSDRKRKKRKSKKTTQKAVELVNKSLKDNDLHTNKEKRSKSNTSTSSKRTSPKRRSHQKVHHMGFSELWTILQTHGWEWRQGPEPYNNVYVPPEGSTKSGSKCGLDFFDDDSALWDVAIACDYIGKPDQPDSNTVDSLKAAFDLEKTSGSVNNSPASTARVSLSASSDDNSSVENLEEEQVSYPCSSGTKTITIESAQELVRLLNNYVHNGSISSLFMKDLFVPMWNMLQEQGGEADNMRWGYEEQKANPLDRAYYFISPASSGVTEGLEGKDFFRTEEAVGLHILRELKSVASKFFSTNKQSLAKLENTLESPFDNEVPRRRKKSRKLESPGSEMESSKKRQTKEYKQTKKITTKEKNKATQKKQPCFEDTGTTVLSKSDIEISQVVSPPYSQRAIEGANMLTEFQKCAANTTVSNTPSTNAITSSFTDLVSMSGVEAVHRKRDNARRRLLKSQQHSGGHLSEQEDGIHARLSIKEIPRSSDKNASRSSSTSLTTPAQFHLTQSPDNMSQELQNNAIVKASTSPEGETANPFDGLFFFGSGVDESVLKCVAELGGKFLSEITSTKMAREGRYKNKLFFLSSPTCRRRLKYIQAGALGVPMVHFDWAKELHRRWTEDDEARPFDSQLYSSMSLPVGLSTESGMFPLQKARHCKDWTVPGEEKGKPALSGMKLVVIHLSAKDEKEWEFALSTLGAVLISHAEFLKSKKDLEVDAILTDNNLLPPHAIAEPERVSKVIRALHVKNSIRGIGCCIPLIDLSWAVQCIIQRRRVLFEDEPRFIIKTDSARTTGMEWDLHTVKVKSGDMDVRYEVGDAIEFSRPERSFGRIVAIQSTQQRGKRIQLRIQLLDEHEKRVLIDGDKKNTLTISENDLRGHIILLSPSDFKRIRNGYGQKLTNIFMLKRA